MCVFDSGVGRVTRLEMQVIEIGKLGSNQKRGQMTFEWFVCRSREKMTTLVSMSRMVMSKTKVSVTMGHEGSLDREVQMQ